MNGFQPISAPEQSCLFCNFSYFYFCVIISAHLLQFDFNLPCEFNASLIESLYSNCVGLRRKIILNIIAVSSQSEYIVSLHSARTKTIKR